MRLQRRRPPAAPTEGRPPTNGDGDRLALLLEALDALPVGVLVQDLRGHTIAANALARSPFGDLAGDALAGASLDRALARTESGAPSTEILDLHGPDPRRLEVTATPLSGGAVVAVLQDTTERRRLDAVRRDFVANVNHELRTPIGAMAVLSEALAGERDHATIERLAGRISAEAERARVLIEDLLDFSRVEADEPARREPVSMTEVVAAATARIQASAEQRGVRVHVPEGTAGVVVGDRHQLITAVANLVDNAVKYSDEGSVVEVATRVDGSDVLVAVADQGIGIPAKDLGRIFERFYRVDSARDRRTGGTGLGLAIARHVATNHGGEITVRSCEGEGSTFELRVPSSTTTGAE